MPTAAQEFLNEKKRVIDEIDSINQKAFSLRNSDPAQSRDLSIKALALSEEHRYPQGKAFAMHITALFHLRSGNLQSAVRQAREALEVFTGLDDQEGMSSTLNTLGIAYRNIGSFDRGLDCLMRSLKIETRRNNRSNIVKLYGNIGNIFNSMGQYSDGLQYYMKCLDIASEMKDANVLADTYSNLGICYQNLREFVKSVRSHKKSLKIRQEMNDQEGIAISLNNLGILYEQQEKYGNALQYYLNSLDIKLKLKMKLETARICNTIGNLYTLIKDYKMAGDYLEKGAKLSREINSNTALRESHLCLSNLFRATGNFEKALEHHMEFHRIDKQLFNSTRIASMEAQLELMNSELYAANTKLEDANSNLSTLSITDGLTGIYNRREFDEFLDREWNRCKRKSNPISLIMLDIDFFKNFNDTYGHIMGDECLRTIAKCLQTQACRSTDLVARFGGEEFAIILSETPAEGAIQVSRAARAAVEALAIPHAASEAARVVTVSIGFASIVPPRSMDSNAFVHMADRALYFSKENGRNRITMFETGTHSQVN